MRQDGSGGSQGRPARLIRRYENRKLYDTGARAYVSLADLARLVREGHELRVEEHPGGEDITAQTLMRIIADEERSGRAPLPNEFLHDVVRLSDRFVGASRDRFERAWNRATELVLERIGPLQQARDDMRRLTERLDELEGEIQGLREPGAPSSRAGQGDSET